MSDIFQVICRSGKAPYTKMLLVYIGFVKDLISQQQKYSQARLQIISRKLLNATTTRYDRVHTESQDAIVSGYFQQVGFCQHRVATKKILSKLQEHLGEDNLKEFSICTSTVSPLLELQLLFYCI